MAKMATDDSAPDADAPVAVGAPPPVDKKTDALMRIRDAQWGADREDGLTSLIREFQALAAEALT